MSRLFFLKRVYYVPLLLAIVLVGCSHQKTNRGHLFRGDWAFEYNRTPWIGCPPDSGVPEADESKSKGLFSCLAKDSDEKNRKGIRRHCGMRSGCTPRNPCCRTLGCGMWVEPEDAAMPVSLGGAARACGMTPFCTPQKPCGLTLNCGKPAGNNLQSLMRANLQSGMVTARGVSPNGMIPNGVGGPMPGSLVSRGIVPGASAITSGGMVAAIGVATPAGTMTPLGVRMPNGMVSNAIVLRACTMTANCTAAHPCGMTPNCGGAVAVNMVSNNAVALASTLQAQGATGGVMQAGGMGTLVNPVTNQPINGLTMAGYTQAGYPPIGYAPTGYAPGYPRFAAGMIDTGDEDDEEEEEPEAVLPETRSKMPVPRFHPIPSQPAFQRSDGMPPTPKTERTVVKPIKTAMNEYRGVSEVEIETALDQAYLEGVSAAMNEVERKLEEKRKMAAKAKMQEKILRQAESVQQQLDEQERQQMLAMQRMRREQQQLRQQAAQQAAQQAEVLLVAAEPVSEPKRLPLPKQTPTSQEPLKTVAVKTNSKTNVNSPQSAASLKTSVSSVSSGVNGMFSSLWGSNPKESVSTKLQTPTLKKALLPESSAEQAAVPTNLPKRPPVSPVPMNYGLEPEDEPGPLILQARFAGDHMPIAP